MEILKILFAEFWRPCLYLALYKFLHHLRTSTSSTWLRSKNGSLRGTAVHRFPFWVCVAYYHSLSFFERKSMVQLNVLSFIPYWCSIPTNLLCGTESNAFLNPSRLFLRYWYFSFYCLPSIVCCLLAKIGVLMFAAFLIFVKIKIVTCHIRSIQNFEKK